MFLKKSGVSSSDVTKQGAAVPPPAPASSPPEEQQEEAWRNLPKAEGVYQWCNGAKIRLATNRAIRVNVRINVLEISAIDQMQEQFTATYTMQLFYVDPMLRDFLTDVHYETDDGLKVERNCKILSTWKASSGGRVRILCQSGLKKELEPTSIQHMRQPDWDADDSSLFRPAFSFGNAVGNAEVIQHVRMLEYCSAAGGHVFEKFKYRTTFVERLELQDLPFDKQMLTMRIYAEEPIWRMQLAPLTDDRAGRLQDKGGVPTDWSVEEKVRVGDIEVPSARVIAWKLSDNSFRSVIDVVVHVRRVPTFYLWNVVVVNFFITLLTYSAYACKPDDFNGRATIQFTLLLTSVGYKIVTNTWVPIKSYLTLMDKYILLNFGTQIVSIIQAYVAIQFACSRVMDDDSDWTDGIYDGPYMGREPPEYECWPGLDNFEGWFAAVIYGLWVLFHAALFLVYRFGLIEKLFESWNETYRENGMLGEAIHHYDKHPYTIAPSPDDDAEPVEIVQARMQLCDDG